MPTYLDDFVINIRETFFKRNPTIDEFSDENLKRGIEDGLQVYSRYRPRRNVSATANLVAGNSSIDLPSNFLRATIAELIFVITGSRPQLSSERARSSSYFRFLSVFDSDLGATSDPPPGFYSGECVITNDGILINSGGGSAKVRLTTNEVGDWALALDTELTQTVDRVFFYDALHEINNLDKFTVPKTDRDILKDIIIGKTLKTLAQDLLTEPLAEKPYSVANQYSALADKYLSSIKRIASFGTVG